MKLFKKLLSFIVICASCVVLATSTGCNTLSEEDEFIVKLYGSVVETEELEVKNGDLEKSTINAVYEIPSLNNNFLINVTGKEGYTNNKYPNEVGTVTCMVALVVENCLVTKIKGIIIIDNENQSFISKITQEDLDELSIKYEPNIYFKPYDNFLVNGATKSCQAICNAVNGAIEYINKEILKNDN